jgi:DNA-binding response OmpR family regulator
MVSSFRPIGESCSSTPPRVVSRQEIEREIWGNSLPDSDTLRSHLYNLRKTIDKPFDKPLLHTVQSAGYRIADIEQPPS